LTVSGWLFDAYPSNDRMVFWIKTESGESVRLEDRWTHSIYVAGASRRALQDLARNEAVRHYVKEHSFVQRYQRIPDRQKSEVLRLTLADSTKAITLGSTIEDVHFDGFRLYNVDILPPQAYFYEHDLFPLARCCVSQQNGRLVWEIDDDLATTDYALPDFKRASIDVSVKQEGRLPHFSDRIDAIRIKIGNETLTIQGQSEADLLREFIDEVARIDPDFVFSTGGDEFVFPYLVNRALTNNVKLTLSREKILVAEPPKGGITYFSYGRVHYRPSTVMLYGRIHIDTQNSFILDNSALQGLFEIARICRIPLQTCSRATIGRCLTSLQFYHAFKRDLLVPWKPANLEKWKSYHELFRADRGGLIFEPVVGVHENVAEFDFVSLYPSIMMKRNVSGETVNCDCCPDSKNVVEELGYHMCEKRRGIVSQSLELPLSQRAKYKHLKKTVTDKLLRDIYDARQNALKWLGVVSFGYLGHANSKFGLIDSHIVVCAIDREVLRTGRNVVECKEFQNLHGIVDSLWTKRDGATREDYAKLKEPIEQATGYDISFEGVYKWIVFLASKRNSLIPVVNRYFGVFEDGNVIKDRGIETRRHDTPPLFSRFQSEVLQVMARGDTVKEVKDVMPIVQEVFKGYKQQLEEGSVPLTELLFTKMLSKDSSAYSVNTAEAGAIYQLRDEGKPMCAGQVLQYVITDYYRKNSKKRAVPVDLIDDDTDYDARRYIELLAEAGNSVTQPFGYMIRPPR